MTHEQLLEQGWICTDGSLETLQYGRKENRSTWQFTEWVTPTYPPSITVKEKLDKWGKEGWRTEIVNLKCYEPDEIRQAVEIYGYKIVQFSVVKNYLSLTTTLAEFMLEGFLSKEASVQITCECLFELNQ